MKLVCFYADEVKKKSKVIDRMEKNNKALKVQVFLLLDREKKLKRRSKPGKIIFSVKKLYLRIKGNEQPRIDEKEA